jgi:hypothetical protein
MGGDREEFQRIPGRITKRVWRSNPGIDQFWYDGYSWDGRNFVYNPFSVLNLFDRYEFANYWFRTGTPTFLTRW